MNQVTTNRHELGMDRHEIVTLSAQTRAPSADIVSREGGGTVIPTQGGGMGFWARRLSPLVQSARVGAA